MLTRILVDGYKSIDHMELSLREFTLFSGVNSAGKSSVIQAIRYMLGMQRRKLGIRAEDMDSLIGRFPDICNDIKGNREIVFELSVCAKEKEEYAVRTNYSGGEGVSVTENRFPPQDEMAHFFEMHKVVYLSAERIGARNAYPMNIENPRDIGSQGEYVYAYFAAYGQEELAEQAFIRDREEIGTSMNNQVNYWLDYLLGFRMQAYIVQDVDQVVIKYSNSRSNHYYRAKEVGTGVTYISTLLIAAFSCKRGDTLIIENPEIHLHPRAQSRFMECMAFLCGRGLQVILETHSDHIYNGMRKCIKGGMLQREEIAAYYFELDASMQTDVTRITFNEQGAEEQHPYGMFDQFDDDLDELIGL